MKNTWTKEECLKEAKKYNSQSEWKKKSCSSFYKAYSHHWIRECLAHTTFFNKEMLKDACIAQAKKFHYRGEWQKCPKSLYYKAKINNWREECCSHMEKKLHLPIVWTKENCIKEALKYKYRNDWRVNSHSSYVTAHYKKWLKECCIHMVKKSMSIWNKEKCIEEAKKYETKKEWMIKNHTSYNVAMKLKIIGECSLHMKPLNKSSWTKEKCLEEAKKHKHRTEFKLTLQACYVQAKNKGWLEECCQHMIYLQKPKNYWNKEKCIEEAKKYKNKKEWYVNSNNSYAAASRNGWIEECCIHMGL